MKKRLLALLLTLCMVVSLLPAQMVTAEGTEDPQQTVVTWSVTADQNKTTVNVGEPVMLSVVASDGNPITEGVNWEVSDPSIASINGANQQATLTGLAAGTVTVTAKSAIPDGVSASITIKIVAGSGTVPPSAPDWLLNADKTTVALGDTVSLTAKDADGNVVNLGFEWSLSDNTLADLSSNGDNATLTPKAAGQVTVTVTDENNVSQNVVIGITQPGSVGTTVLGDHSQLNAVETNGVFTPPETGRYVFFVESQDDDWGINFESHVTTNMEPYRFLGGYGYRVNLTGDVSYNINVVNNLGQTMDLRIMMVSADAPDLALPEGTLHEEGVGSTWTIPVLSVSPDGVLGPITWSVDNPSVATIVPQGDVVTITFIDEGVVTLKATDDDSGKFVEHNVNVIPAGQGGGGGGTPAPTPVPILVGETKSMTFDEANAVDAFVFEFTPTESANYVMYRQYANDRPALGMEVYNIQDGSAVTVNNADTWLGGEDYLHSFRFALTAGETYHIIFSWSGSKTVEYTLQKECLPTAIAFPVEKYSNFVGSGDGLDMKMTPVYAAGNVTYTVADPSIATVNSWGGLEYLAPGETTLTATCGTATATVDVVSRAPVKLKTGEQNITNTSTGTRIRYSYTPERTANFNFDFTAGVKIGVGLWDAADQSNIIGHWFVEAGQNNSQTFTLEEGKTYTIDVSMDYTQQDVSLLITVEAPPAELILGDAFDVNTEGTFYFTPETTGKYTIYREFPANNMVPNVSWAVTDENGTTVNGAIWTATDMYGNSYNGQYFDLEADKTYELKCSLSSYSGNLEETFYLQSADDPQAIVFSNGGYDLYLGASSTPPKVVGQPIYSYWNKNDISYSIADESIAFIDEYGFLAWNNVGTTEITATYKGMSVTAPIKVRDHVRIRLNEENRADSDDQKLIKGNIQVAESGSYILNVYATDDVYIKVDPTTISAERQDWDVPANERNDHTLRLEANETYQVQILGGGDFEVELKLTAPQKVEVGKAYGVNGTEEFVFTPAKDGKYTFYQTYAEADNDSAELDWRVEDTETGESIQTSRRYASIDENYSAALCVWEMKAGHTYKMTCTSWDESRAVVLNFREACAPTSLSFGADPVIVYMDGAIFPVFPKAEPFYADFEEWNCDITIGNETIADMSQGGPTPLKVGKTTITATYGDLSTTAVLEVRDMVHLPINKIVTATTNQNADIYYKLDVPEDGEYSFLIVSDKVCFVPMHMTPGVEQEGFYGRWEPGEYQSVVIRLKADEENWIRVQGVERGQEVSVLLTREGMQEGIADVSFDAKTGSLDFVSFLGNGKMNGENAWVQTIKGGKLGDLGGYITDPVYWTNRTFQGWEGFLAPYNEEGGYDEYQAESLGIFTTAQVMDYTFDQDGKYFFRAKWSGEDADYTTLVRLNTMDVEMRLTNAEGDDEPWPANWMEHTLRQNNTTIGSQVSYKIVEIPDHPEFGAFQGWIQTKYFEKFNAYERVTDTIYTTAQVMAMTVPADDTVFFPKWENLTLDDYKTMFTEWGVRIMEKGVLKVDELKLDTVYRVITGYETYFTYTVPETGMYTFFSNATTGDIVVDIGSRIMGYGFGIWDNSPQAVELTKGEEISIKLEPYSACKFWVEKTNEVKKIKIVSQDKTKTYLGGDNFSGYYTLGDIELMVTFADGTTQTMNGKEFFGDGRVPATGEIIEYDWELDETEAKITLSVGDVAVDYTVNLTDKKITKMEVIPYTGLKIYENTSGYLAENEQGEEFFYYDVEDFWARHSTYKFTWSDGTVETYTMGEDEYAPVYQGIRIWCSGNQEEKPWGIGKNTMTVYFDDLTANFQVEVLANNVRSIEVMDLGVKQYVLGDTEYFASWGEGWSLDYMETEGLVLKVTYKDGTTKTFTDADQTEIADMILVDGSVLAMYVDKLITKTGKEEMIVEYMGCTDTIEIEIVEKIVSKNQAVLAPSVVEEELAKVDQTTTEIVIDASSHKADETDNTKTEAAKLPLESLEKVADAKVDMTVKMDNAQITFDATAMEAIAKQTGKTAETQITLTVKETAVEELTDKQQKRIEKALKKTEQAVVLDLTLVAGEQVISDFSGGEITVRIPFTPPAGTKGEDYVVFYVSPDGKTVEEMKTTYVNGELVFTTTHFSDYVALTSAPETEDDNTSGGSGSIGGTSSGNSAQSGKTPAPNTGDEANIFGLTAMMVLSGMLAAAFLALRKRQRA